MKNSGRRVSDRWQYRILFYSQVLTLIMTLLGLRVILRYGALLDEVEKKDECGEKYKPARLKVPNLQEGPL